jgi:hypothetical protein
MPSFDITGARAELMAEREPVSLRLGGHWYEFPGVMPAEIEFLQMELGRKLADVPDGAPAVTESLELMRAAFGEKTHGLMLERRCSPMEMQIGLGELLKYWNAPYADPNFLSRITAQVQNGANGNGRRSLAHASTSSRSSRPTSSVNTESIFQGPSGSSGSPGDDSSRSMRGSQETR